MKKIAFCISKGGERYRAALLAAGMEPVEVPVASGNMPEFPGVSGLLLVGGEDIDPKLYGQEPGPDTGKPNLERDKTESWLLEQAFRRNLPVLAICRGMQMLNVFLGGSLIQHLPTAERHNAKAEDKSLPVHRVAIEPGSSIGLAFGASLINVNSRHHQGLDVLGKNVRVVGRCPDDGVIEAIEVGDGRFVWGVQWHPENMLESQGHAKRLFEAFAQAL